jgi:hypothetical protein
LKQRGAGKRNHHAEREATRVHHAARRGGSRVAARRERSAAGSDAAHRCADALRRRRFGRTGSYLYVPAGTATIRLDRRRQSADRLPLVPRCRPHSETSGGIGRARAGRHPGHWYPEFGTVATGDPHLVGVADPVGAGFVDTLARPGGNVTGFMLFEYSLGGKWLELLKQIAPGVTRAAVIRDPAVSSGTGQFGAIQSVASSLGVEVSPVKLRDAPEIERAVAAFARSANGGLIVTASALATVHRHLIITLAARHKLPAVYPNRYYVTGGGLISYGPDFVDLYRLAAGYVDRILKGEKPADLPVQAPTKYELVINLKTAKALGLDVPPMLISRADEVIE